MGWLSRICDPYNTMGASRERPSARERRARESDVERVARQWNLTLEAAAEFAPAVDDAETYGVSTPRGSRASDICDDILSDPANRKDWYGR